MMTMYPNVRFKRVNPDAPAPTYAHEGDAGLDLCSMEDVTLAPGETRTVGTGVAMAIPEGFVGLVAIRSGWGRRGLTLTNAVGVIDSTYRGEIGLILHNNHPTQVFRPVFDSDGEVWYHEYLPNDDIDDRNEFLHIHKGDRVAQMLVMPVAQASPIESAVLDETERNTGGFGSTGTGRL